MGYGGIVTGVVFATVALMPAEFSTRDVSEHRLMLDAHPEPRHSHYHAFVGKELKALSDGRGALVLEEIRKRTPRGSVWRKREGAVVGRAVPRDRKKDVAAVRRGSPQVEPVSATPAKEQRLDLGPQHAGDGAFAKVMRRHQSWYRTVVLKAPYGTGPKATANDSTATCSPLRTDDVA